MLRKKATSMNCDDSAGSGFTDIEEQQSSEEDFKDAEVSLETSDYLNIALLVSLYILQGIPLGLVHGSIPFLLKEQLSLTQIGFFTFTTYPYSLKILWAPIVDSLWWPSLGPRKSWIVPAQLLSASLLLLGSTLEISPSMDLGQFSLLYFLLILCAATQDIAVDGWALHLLPKHQNFASTAQSAGLTTGYLLSFTVFLAFNSIDFCNNWIRSVPSDEPLISFPAFLIISAISYYVLTFVLVLLKKESQSYTPIPLSSAYAQLKNIALLPSVQQLMTCLLMLRAGTHVAPLRLIDRGFKKEWFAGLALIEFPIEIGVSILAGRLAKGSQPLYPWRQGFLVKIGLLAIAPMIIYFAPTGEWTWDWIFIVSILTLVSTFASTAMFVSFGAFFFRIADPAMGGTYLTLLNTFSNLGSSWPKFVLLMLVDYLSSYRCERPFGSIGPAPIGLDGDCSACKAAGFVCNIESDGFFPVAVMGFFYALFFIRLVIMPRLLSLQALPRSAWIVTN